MTFSVSEFTLSLCWQDFLTERPEKERVIEGTNDGTKRKDVRSFAQVVSTQVPVRRLFEEFRITKKPLQSNSKTALEIFFHQKRCSSVQSDYISPLAH